MELLDINIFATFQIDFTTVKGFLFISRKPFYVTLKLVMKKIVGREELAEERSGIIEFKAKGSGYSGVNMPLQVCGAHEQKNTRFPCNLHCLYS